MKQTSLTRRLVAGATGLMIGAIGALAFAAPASAVVEEEAPAKTYSKLSTVQFIDDCEGTEVVVKSGKVFKNYKWTISVDGEKVWSEWVKRGKSDSHVVPSDAGELIEVDFKFSSRGWPVSHSWVEPEDCEEPTEPVEPEVPLEGIVEWEFDCDNITVVLHNETQVDVTFTVVPSNGDSVDVTVGASSSSEPLSFPASEGLTIDLLVEGESVFDELIEITAEEWASLDCDEGEGGELPVTGSSTALIAAGAVALLALGGGMFLIARRRRVTFTA